MSLTAGRSTNRTSATVDGGPVTTYCYDLNDKLTSTNDARYPTVAYDSRGNTTTLGGEALVYDGANRHVQTTKGTTVVRYGRDATDRIVDRKVGGVTVARYSYSAGGDSGDATLDALGNVVEKTIPLIGGVLLTTRTTGDVWSYPNVHGDVVATANAAGVKQGSTLHYDPYGQTWNGVPDNSAGNMDYGWLGQYQRPSRPRRAWPPSKWVPGRTFRGWGVSSQMDPLEGGSANDYDYVAGDPLNSFDLDGNASCPRFAKRACRAVRRYVGGAVECGPACGARAVLSDYGTVRISACAGACVTMMESRGGGTHRKGITVGSMSWPPVGASVSLARGKRLQPG